MADVTGPISSLPGASYASPSGTMCDEHPDQPAVARVQGETDSFGSEMHDLCRECLADFRSQAASAEARKGRCEWCKRGATDLRDTRDYDEGMCGPVYRVCGACRTRQQGQAKQDLDDWEERNGFGDESDYGDDVDEPLPSEDLPRAYEARSSQWRFKEHWSGETGDYRMGSVTAWVRDYDGDFAGYHVKRGEEILLEGECHDLDQAIKAVEDKLVEIGWLAPAPYGEDDGT